MKTTNLRVALYGEKPTHKVCACGTILQVGVDKNDYRCHPCTWKGMVEEYLEKGDKCPECGGEMGYEPVENCSCHISPPCHRCVNNQLVCLECGWEAQDENN